MREPRWLPLRLTHQGALMKLVITSTRKVAKDENVDANVILLFINRTRYRKLTDQKGDVQKAL